MATATFSVELSEEDRERFDRGIEAMRELAEVLKKMPNPVPGTSDRTTPWIPWRTYPDPLPVIPAHPTIGDFPPFTPVWCGTSEVRTVTAEGTVTWNS